MARIRPLTLALVPSLLLACERGPTRTNTAPPTEPTTTVAVAATPTLDHAWMRAFVERFAADDMQGRFTLDRDAIGRAADQLAQGYRELGLGPVGEAYRVGFRFPFGTVVERGHHVWVDVAGDIQALPMEQFTTLSTAGETAVMAELVWVGSDPALPSRPSGHPSAVHDRIALLQPAHGPADVPLSPDALTARLKVLRDAGARAVLVVGDGNALSQRDREALESRADASGLPVLLVARNAAAGLCEAAGESLAALEKPARASKPRVLADVRISLAPRRTDKFEQADNVLAQLPGSEHPEEIVIVGAHYDHIGRRDAGAMCRGDDDICNGADDNASGTAMVAAMARAWAKSGRRPKRTVVFAHFAGEELGLHGSKALADAPPDAPPFRGGRVVAMLNFDMVGRLGEPGLSIGGLDSSPGWMPLLDRLGSHGLPIVYEGTVNSRSDQASFYARGVPVLFFFTGMHDDYHRATDHADKLDYDGMNRIGDLALALVVEVADGAALPFSGSGEAVGRLPGSDERTVIKRVARPAPAP
ncbi:MAG: M20/M25/M40 family metallo-hydrolase [Nannocystaceae bacterium]|nr:M20/M25/M40 family metallo-hydrolase [Nannocystaceae bacterium]